MQNPVMKGEPVLLKDHVFAVKDQVFAVEDQKPDANPVEDT